MAEAEKREAPTLQPSETERASVRVLALDITRVECLRALAGLLNVALFAFSVWLAYRGIEALSSGHIALAGVRALEFALAFWTFSTNKHAVSPLDMALRLAGTATCLIVLEHGVGPTTHWQASTRAISVVPLILIWALASLAVEAGIALLLRSRTLFELARRRRITLAPELRSASLKTLTQRTHFGLPAVLSDLAACVAAGYGLTWIAPSEASLSLPFALLALGLLTRKYFRSFDEFLWSVKPHTERVLTLDPRRPIYFARSFPDDRARLPSLENFLLRGRHESLERAFTSSHWALGPLVTFENEKQPNLEFRALRLPSDPDGWKREARVLIAQSSLIPCLLSSTEGFAEELRFAVEAGRLRRVIFGLSGELTLFTQSAAWQKHAEEISRRIRVVAEDSESEDQAVLKEVAQIVESPSRRVGVCALWIQGESTVRLIRSHLHTAEGMRLAVSLASSFALELDDGQASLDGCVSKLLKAEN